MEGGKVVDFFIELKSERESDTPAQVGNVYKGKVVKIRRGHDSVFVDINCGKNAILNLNQDRPSSSFDKQNEGSQVISDDLSSYYDSSSVHSWEDSSLRVGDNVLVQITREQVGIVKGPKLTRNIKLINRHIVYMPFVDVLGVSNRIQEEEERLRLEGILKNICRPGEGAVVRTFGKGMPESTFRKELDELIKIWEDIQSTYSKKRKPGLCYQEPRFIQRILREIFDNKLDEIWVDTEECVEEVRKFSKTFLSSTEIGCRLYEGEHGPLFEKFGIEKELRIALSNKVYLRSGGSINIDQTEAMVSVDVNTGKYKGKSCAEETILTINLEAADEIARQLRLRNCGGIIVIDFIDMDKEEHKEKVFQYLLKILHKDRTKYNIMPMSGLGMVEMSRKQVRDTLVRVVCAPCHYCQGSGWVKSPGYVCHELLRDLKAKLTERQRRGGIDIYAHPKVIEKLGDKEEFSLLESMQHELGQSFHISSDRDFHIHEYSIHWQD